MGTQQNLREQLGIKDHYVDYCREERNFAAILYHLLLDEKCLASFLALIRQPAALASDVRIYFEYAHLRDLWAEVASRNQDVNAQNHRYRDAIASLLPMPPGNELPGIETDCRAFNEFFTGLRARAASVKHIQMPSRWSDSQFDHWCDVGGPDFAMRACSLKWAFNAKPDLVLHLGGDKVVCIEAKLGSGMGSYQVKSDRLPSGSFAMTQTALQKFILHDLLGYDTDFIVISNRKDRKEGDSSPWRHYSWQEVYGALLHSPSPPTGESPTVASFRKSRFIHA